MLKRRRTEEPIDVEVRPSFGSSGLSAKAQLARPTLIYVSPAGGRLLLGPLPTSTNEGQFGSVSMQVSCMGSSGGWLGAAWCASLSV